MRGLLQYDINVLNIISTVNAKGDSLQSFAVTFLINRGGNIKAKFSATNTKNNFAIYQALLKLEVAIISSI